ncbi:MAG: hypothetical protein DRJ10_02450 [Bacteroidetes bacterium]|nr:MAG: hypothetical protein DRJ10_02450 [Bacteroidota bacterium]
MGKKIFISYKYGDKQVFNLPNAFFEPTTARHYVDDLQEMLDKEDHINKGENDGEEMGSLADSTIGSKLGDKIFDSTVTIVLISKGMKDDEPEKEQWIPWEISYSLREQSRQGTNSKTNAILAIVLPDETGNYEFYITRNNECGSRTLKTDFLFTILADNMFNIKNPETRQCNGTTIYSGYSSYIYSVKWEDFKSDIDKYIEIAVNNYQNKDNYEIIKNLK